jgi:signal transduction histidine kinase
LTPTHDCLFNLSGGIRYDGMNVALISRDESLQRLCREALSSLPDGHCNLLVASEDGPPPAADLSIWDWEDRGRFPRWAEQPPGNAHIFVISRAEAAAILDGAAFPAVTLVLKPVNVDTLRTLVKQAASRAWRKDRDAMLDSLLATNLRLQEFDQDRMNFLARAVHDFRTPLTAVNGYCGLLLSEELGPLTAAQKEVLERTLHGVRRLSRLAAALFQWSSGQRLGMQSQIREADIRECCRQALHEIKPFTDGKNISVELVLEPPEEPLHFDPAQMEQVLINLLENSCKFTPRGGHIAIRGFPAFWERRSVGTSAPGFPVERRHSVSRRANVYRMEVSDNGMGVAPEQMRTIFQEYTSYGGGKDRSGSGLGLAICKRIIEAHDGRIFAESAHQGVTFIFMLPFTPAGASAELLSPSTVGAHA